MRHFRRASGASRCASTYLTALQVGGLVSRQRRIITASATAAGLIAIVAALFVLPDSPVAHRPIETKTDSPPIGIFPEVRFADVTASAGIDFRHINGAAGDLLMPEMFGSGCAFFDYDNDGHPDILLINSCGWSQPKRSKSVPTMALYHNNGRGSFENVTGQAGLDVVLYGMGVAVGDFDSDGYRDLYITALGRNRLFRNLGDGTFADVTNAAGVGGRAADWSTSCGWFDYDNDGDLDLFVCTYVKWSRELNVSLSHEIKGARSYLSPNRFDGTHCVLYRNDGDGAFTDVSRKAGLKVIDVRSGRPASKALGVCFFDVDSDGWMDVIVANDQVTEFLFHNERDGTFEEIARRSGLSLDRKAAEIAGMGIDVAVLPNDNRLAIAIGNIADFATPFFVSGRDRIEFLDIAPQAGIAQATTPLTTFGVVFFDYDLDGWLDLLQANGSINTPEGSAAEGFDYRQPNQLFRYSDRPGALFSLVPQTKTGSALPGPNLGRGATYADIDADGDLDVLITRNNGSALLLRNDQQLGHHWLRLRLIDTGGNRDAIGARIEIRLGNDVLHRQVRPTRSYLSQVELPVTIGLGSRGQVDELRIIWPDGSRQIEKDVTIDALTLIKKRTDVRPAE